MSHIKIKWTNNIKKIKIKHKHKYSTTKIRCKKAMQQKIL